MTKSQRIRLRASIVPMLALILPITAGALTDSIDLPFKDDPAVLGRWKTVAFVHSIESFVPAEKPAQTDLYLKEVVFLPQGKTTKPMYTWTEGVLLDSANKTADRYAFKLIGGLKFMFLEWKTGDYVLRDLKPEYYVLVRDSDLGKMSAPVEEGFTDFNFVDCMVSVPLGGVCKHPLPRGMHQKALVSLPHYDSSSLNLWQVDLRGRDLSKLALAGRSDDLLHASFDVATKFPKDLPQGFAPDRIMEMGKNPGLSVRSLHNEGITGKGVSMAIIDQNLFVDHAEYADRVRSYEELHWAGNSQEASMHAGAVASIAVGKDCGVAPEATIYYIADWFGDNSSVMNYAFLATAIDRVISFNASSPKENKIRVVTIERGFAPHEKGYAEVNAAIERAKKDGIFVVTSSLEHDYGFKFNGLGREPLSDPDDKASYGPGLFLQRDSFYGLDSSTRTLLVPMDSRTTASPTGPTDYVFYREGGWSWAIPYVAGLYALACQVKPDITPALFWEKALETGDILTAKKDGREFQVGKIVNPRKIIMSLQ